MADDRPSGGTGGMEPRDRPRMPGRTQPPGGAVRNRPASTVRRPVEPLRVRPQAGGPVFADQKVAIANRLSARVAGAIALLLALAWVAGRGVLFAPPSLPEDAADTAQIARHLARGEGYRTSCVRPLAVAHGSPVGVGPELTRAPVMPTVVAVLLRLRPNDGRVVRLAGVLGLIVCAVLLWILASREFGRGAGWLAASLALLNPGVVGAASAGSGGVWSAALLAGALLAARRLLAGESTARLARPTIAATMVGALAAAAYLAEYALLLAVLLLLGTVLLASPRGGRRAVAFGLAIGFGALALPWWIRNTLVAGNPLFTLDRYACMLMTPEHPGTSVYRTLEAPGNPYVYLATHPTVVLVNLIRLAAGFRDQLAPALGVVPLVAALVLCLTPLRQESDRGWRRILLAMGLGVIVATGVTIPFTTANYLPLLPLVCLLGAVCLTRLVGALSGVPRAVGIAVVGIALVAPPLLGRAPSDGAEWAATAANLQALAQQSPEGMLAITDAPGIVAWNLDRPALWLPARQEDLQALEQRSQASSVFFLTRALSRWSPADGAAPYQALAFGTATPQGLQRVQLPVPGDALLVPGGTGGESGGQAP